MKSLLEQLPSIVAEGKREAERVIERAESNYRLGLQTREFVVPSKDSKWQDMFQKERGSAVAEHHGADNALIYGDNLLAMAALIAGGSDKGTLRNKVDFIYIDPPFDSKADYRTKIVLPDSEIQQSPSVLEQFAYSDTWSDGTASYLQMITPRLALMRELLSDIGSIYIHIDRSVGPYVKIIADEIFGRYNFENEIIWRRTTSRGGSEYYNHVHDNILFYTRNGCGIWNQQYTPYTDGYIDGMFRKVDDQGRRYRESPLTAPGRRDGDSGRPWKGVDPNQMGKGRHWAVPGFLRHLISQEAQCNVQKSLDELESIGRIIWAKDGAGRPNVVQYVDDLPGVELQSMWTDIGLESGPECAALTQRSGGAIRVSIRRYADSAAFVELLRQGLSGSRVQGNKIEALGDAITKAENPRAIWLQIVDDLEKLAEYEPGNSPTEGQPTVAALMSAGLTANDLNRIAQTLQPDTWLSLLLTPVQSVPVYEFRAREGEYIPFENASAGQQATALLKTLLNQPGPPLIIDQPEEDLDNPVMLEIVEQLWEAKRLRQIVFASHNANLVVNGDAELVTWFGYRAAGDESRGTIKGEGAIDVPDAREAIKRIMEGGESAFRLRREKYGF